MEKDRIKVFKDSALTEEVEIFDLGRIEVGTQKTFEFYVKNVNEFDLEEMEFSISNPEVKIIAAPEKLKVNESAKLVLEWTATATMKRPLRTSLVFNGAEIWK